MSSRLRDIATSCLGRFGIPGIADVHICADSDGGAPYTYWKDLCHGNQNNFHTDIETALGLMTTGRNDVLLLTPDNHTQGDSITWNKNMTHFVGMFPPAMMNQRSRIGHNANFNKLLDVTGYGNLFANLYFMYGRGNAANLNCLTVSGERNTFMNCHFLLGNATEGDTATFKLIDIRCNEGYFYKCTFGNDTVAWGATDLMQLYGAADRSCRVVFEDCLFIMNQDAGADGNFISTVAGMGSGCAFFLNCQFVNIGTTMTAAVDGTGLGNAKLFFDSRCCFANVTDITTSGPDASIYCGLNYAGAAATANLIASFPDNS
jgi:hypothetical protein